MQTSPDPNNRFSAAFSGRPLTIIKLGPCEVHDPLWAKMSSAVTGPNKKRKKPDTKPQAQISDFVRERLELVGQLCCKNKVIPPWFSDSAGLHGNEKADGTEWPGRLRSRRSLDRNLSEGLQRP
ncbi:hypothetical protein AAG570_002045 [Ranatra chinensis]|uniref:Uncharacterized protein n=1 Tax=Ranatra chinensis TaxID=642074 RepID=A0ABD0YAA8_9HEMI